MSFNEYNKSRQRDWICKNCDITFKTRATYFAHRRDVHKNSQFFECFCKFCGKKLTSRTGRSLHEKSCKENPNRVNGRNFGRHYSEEVLNKSFRNNPKQGGLREGSGRGKKGWYKGFYCRSTWELAWLIYEIEVNNSKVEACHESFDYELDGKKHKYYPDFKIGDTYFEIKGWHKPDVDAKMQQFPKDKKYVLIEGKQQIAKYLNYAIEKYGNDLTALYEVKDKRGADEGKFHTIC